MKYQKIDRGIELEVEGQHLKIYVEGERIFRILRCIRGEILNGKSYMVESHRESIQEFYIQENEDCLELKTSWGAITVCGKTARLTFTDRNGRMLIQDETGIIEKGPLKRAIFRTETRTEYYGLGQHQKGVLSYRGSKVELKHDNTTIAIPFLITDQRYGILWDNNGRIWADFTRDGSMVWESETGNYTDYYFIYGPTMEEVIEGYWKLTGPSPMIPRGAFGFWQSKMRYMSQQELLQVGEKYRQKHYPVEILVVDFYHWTQMGDFQFDPEAWPDPEGMFTCLKKLNISGMVSIWPYISEKSFNFSPMRKDQMLVYNQEGDAIRFTIFNGEKSGLYDPFNPQAREYIWEKAKEYYRQGARIFWLDSCEPDDALNIEDFRDFGILTLDGPLDERINAYALMHEKTFYEGQRDMDPDRRALIFARAAFAGCQRYGVTVWSGDIGYDFKALRWQITAGLNAAMSGLPFWTTDIGGFQGGDPKNSDYRELYIRWFQYGAFCPLFRVHGSRGAICFEDLVYGISRGENEVWSFGEELESIMVEYVRLRYKIMPYIYSCAKQTMEKGTPMMRALVIDFSGDPKTAAIEDQFMFGPALMVCPVLESGVSARKVYLPEGCEWYDFWSNKKYSGGSIIDASAPLERIPVYVKAGAIIPEGPVEQYTGQIQKPDLLIKVYPGQDGTFHLYCDDGETFGYEKGEYCLIRFRWNEEEKKLEQEICHGSPQEFYGSIAFKNIM